MCNSVSSFTDNRDSKIYNTVKIGNQIWMAENLDYAGNGGVYYDNTPLPPFARAGRLYTWEQAMAAVPQGWHLPSDAERDILITAVGGTSIAGRHLKATDGWTSRNQPYNGIDIYGFAALPGGYGDLRGEFHGVGNFGWWWSGSEISPSHVRCLYIQKYDGIQFRNSDKHNLCSVRCVKD